jgi:uncharacterized protein (DUF2249 family)
MDTSGQEKTLDVRGLEPPEPMVLIMRACARLEPGGTLLVVHDREPMPLYEKLRTAGYAWKSERRGEEVRISIKRPADP